MNTETVTLEQKVYRRHTEDFGSILSPHSLIINSFPKLDVFLETHKIFPSIHLFMSVDITSELLKMGLCSLFEIGADK